MALEQLWTLCDLVRTLNILIFLSSSEGLNVLSRQSMWSKHVPSAGAAGAVQMKEILDTELSSIKSAGTEKIERVITTAQAASIKVEGSQRKILNFCANNYLGLSVSTSNTEDCGFFCSGANCHFEALDKVSVCSSNKCN